MVSAQRVGPTLFFAQFQRSLHILVLDDPVGASSIGERYRYGTYTGPPFPLQSSYAGRGMAAGEGRPFLLRKRAGLLRPDFILMPPAFLVPAQAFPLLSQLAGGLLMAGTACKKSASFPL